MHRSDAIFFGAVGLPDRDKTLPLQERPERVALLELRKGLFANLRHIVLPKNLASRCPLKNEIIEKGIDIMIIRELTGGLYYGQPQGVTGAAPDRKAVDTMAYSEMEVRRILRVGFETAMKRRKKLLSVDKANILATSGLWREVCIAMSKEYPDVALEHMYVDNASMQLLRRPSEFDVIVTENTFGDILSDEASMLAGSIGLVPSACLGNEFLAKFDPTAKAFRAPRPFMNLFTAAPRHRRKRFGKSRRHNSDRLHDAALHVRPAEGSRRDRYGDLRSAQRGQGSHGRFGRKSEMLRGRWRSDCKGLIVCGSAIAE